MTTGTGFAAQPVTPQQLEKWFAVRQLNGSQQGAYTRIIGVAKELSEVILQNTPGGAGQAQAIEALREVCMLAQNAILYDGGA